MKLVALRTLPQSASAECIAVLEDALERARSGEVIAVALAEARRDGTTASQVSNEEHRPTLIGGVTILQARLTKEILDEEDGDE